MSKWISVETPPPAMAGRWLCSDEVLVAIEYAWGGNPTRDVRLGVYDHRLKVWTNGGDKLLTPDPEDAVVFWMPKPAPPAIGLPSTVGGSLK